MVFQQSPTQRTAQSILKLQLSWLKRSVFKVVVLMVVLNALTYFVATTFADRYSAPVSEVMFVVDHFEDNGWAILEVNTGPLAIIDFPRALLLNETEEGDILVFQRFENGAVYMKFDHEEERRRLEQARLWQEKIKKVPPGDIEL